MVRSAGLEPATPGFEGRCSIQLSYERTLRKYSVICRAVVVPTRVAPDKECLPVKKCLPGKNQFFFSFSAKAFSSFFTFGMATAATYGWFGFRAAKSWW